MTPSPIREPLAVCRLFSQTGSAATPRTLVIIVVTPAILTGGTSHGEEAQANCQADRQEICIKEGAAETSEGSTYRRACRVNPPAVAEDFDRRYTFNLLR